MLPQQDPVRPIDPRAWVLHTQAMGNMAPPSQPPASGDQFLQGGGKYLPYAGAMSTVASTITTTSSSLKSSSVVEVQNTQNKFVSRNDEPLPVPLTCNHEPEIIIRAMAQSDSGLPIRDRLWLKITIYNAFIGWLHALYDGLHHSHCRFRPCRLAVFSRARLFRQEGRQEICDESSENGIYQAYGQ